MIEYLCASPECPNGLHRIADKAMEGVMFVIVEITPGSRRRQIKRHKWVSSDGSIRAFLCDDCQPLSIGDKFIIANSAQEGRQE